MQRELPGKALFADRGGGPNDSRDTSDARIKVGEPLFGDVRGVPRAECIIDQVAGDIPDGFECGCSRLLSATLPIGLALLARPHGIKGIGGGGFHAANVPARPGRGIWQKVPSASAEPTKTITLPLRGTLSGLAR